MGKFGIKNIWDINSGGSAGGNVVTTNTNQTITGDKQFNSNIQVNGILEVKDKDDGNTWANIECDAGNLHITSGNNVNIDIHNKKIINVATPTNNTDAANKAYVDSHSANVDTSNFVTTNTTQSISGVKIFNTYLAITNIQTSGESLRLQNPANQPLFMAWFNGNTRIGFAGKENGTAQSIKFKSEIGDLELDCKNTSHSISVCNKNISNLKEPTENQHAATKNYVDNKVGNWVKIVNGVTINTTNTTLTQARDWTANLNNFTYTGTHTYLVQCKITGLISNQDMCANCIIQTNSTQYDNAGQLTICDKTGTHNLIVKIHLGQDNKNKINYYLPSGFSKDGNLSITCWIKDIGVFSN